MSAISKIILSWEGKEIKEFASFTEKSVKHGEQVALVNGTTFCELTPQYAFELEYVEPIEGPFDFQATVATPATVTILYQGKRKRVYRGVQLLEEGDAKVDGKSARTQSYTFMATDRDDS